MQTMILTILDLVGLLPQDPAQQPENNSSTGSPKATPPTQPESLQTPTDLGPEGIDAASETTTYVEETFRFLALPPLWVIALVILPATVAFVWWSFHF